LRDVDAQIEQHRIRSVVIGLGDNEQALRFESEMNLNTPVLVDADRNAYCAAGFANASILHLFRLDNMRSRARAKAAGHRQKWLGMNPMQLGGTLVIAADDRVLLAYRSKTFGDNASPKVISEALSKL
jgi:hypothetical protein